MGPFTPWVPNNTMQVPGTPEAPEPMGEGSCSRGSTHTFEPGLIIYLVPLLILCLGHKCLFLASNSQLKLQPTHPRLCILGLSLWAPQILICKMGRRTGTVVLHRVGGRV